MNQIENKYELIRLTLCRSNSDIYDVLNIYLKFMFDVIDRNSDDVVFSYADRDAKMVFQMMFSKVAHIKKVLEGIKYESKSGVILHNITDPTTIGVLIRNVYETVAMFNLIYRQTNNNDEKTILYNLWVHAGLKYRQRFESAITTKEGAGKFEDERREIQQLRDEIENTEKFKQLSPENQKVIKDKLKAKDYKICFKHDEVKDLSWQGVIEVMDLKNNLLDNIYNYFSLYAHPSNVAVFQFSEMFNKENEAFHDLTNFNLKNMLVLLSIFIADYINIFPTVLETFKMQSPLEQSILNFHNRLFRGDEYSINDAHLEFE